MNTKNCLLTWDSSQEDQPVRQTSQREKEKVHTNTDRVCYVTILKCQKLLRSSKYEKHGIEMSLKNRLQTIITEGIHRGAIYV